MLFRSTGVELLSPTSSLEHRIVAFKYVPGRGWLYADRPAAVILGQARDMHWLECNVSPVAHVRKMLGGGAHVVSAIGEWKIDGSSGRMRPLAYDCFIDEGTVRQVAWHDRMHALYWPLKRWVAQRVWAPDGKRAKAMLAELL